MRILNDFLADLRFTCRQFRKSIGLSLVAVGSIALGIGASSAIFSLVYAWRSSKRKDGSHRMLLSGLTVAVHGLSDAMEVA